MKKIEGLDQRRKIQALIPPGLITIGAVEIALVGQNEAEPRKLPVLGGTIWKKRGPLNLFSSQSFY
jgi:hypothetical protein